MAKNLRASCGHSDRENISKLDRDVRPDRRHRALAHRSARSITIVDHLRPAGTPRVTGAPEGGGEGRKFVPYFGETLGFVINYTPDEAVRYNLEGHPVEILEEAYRPGEIEIRIGGRLVPPGCGEPSFRS